MPLKAIAAFVDVAAMYQNLSVTGNVAATLRARFAEFSHSILWQCACLYDDMVINVEVFAELLWSDPALAAQVLDKFCEQAQNDSLRTRTYTYMPLHILKTVFGALFREKPEEVPARLELLWPKNASLPASGFLREIQKIATVEGLKAGHCRMVLDNWRKVAGLSRIDADFLKVGLHHNGVEFLEALGDDCESVVTNLSSTFMAGADARVMNYVCDRFERIRASVVGFAGQFPKHIPVLSDCPRVLVKLLETRPSAFMTILREALLCHGASAILRLAASGLLARVLAAAPGLVPEVYALESAEAWAAVLAAMNATDPAGIARALEPHLSALKPLLRSRRPRDCVTEAALVVADMLETA